MVINKRFALVLKTNWIRQHTRKLPSSSYNHNTLTTFSEGVITNALQSTNSEVMNHGMLFAHFQLW